MRARIVPLRDIHEKYGAEVKPFDPSFVIPRHVPGWETMEGAQAKGMVFKPAPIKPGAAGASAGSKRPVYIEVKRRP